MPLADFWIKQTNWPRDIEGYVFLGRAVQDVGRAMFGRSWTGNEFKVQLPPNLPSRPTSRVGERVQARQLLSRHRPDIELAPVTKGTQFTLPIIPITDEQWRIAFEIEQKLRAEVMPVVRRQIAVEEEIAQRCADGVLESAYRPLAGGDYRPIPQSWWNTEHTHERFVMCQINPHDPFGRGLSGDHSGWIFLTRDSLDRYVLTQPFAPSPAGIDVHLSPYMRVMWRVARELQITPTNQPKKEVVIAALRQAWANPTPLSKKLAETMATLLREPVSQLGRARRR